MRRSDLVSLLKHQHAVEEALEELIADAEQREFSAVAADICSHLEYVCEGVVPQLSLKKKNILALNTYTAIQLYKDVPLRKTKKRYMHHPLQLVNILLGAGCDDIITLLAALYHDVPEELFKLARKNDDTRSEEQIIRENVSDVGRATYLSLLEDMTEARARHIASDVMQTVSAVTKKKDQLYYPYIGRIFSVIGSSRRAMHVKVADAVANVGELYSPKAALLRHDEIPFDSIVQAYEERNSLAISSFQQRTRGLGKRENHPKTEDFELKGSDWMKALYKGAVVLLAYRAWSLATGKRDRIVESIPLAQEIHDKAKEVLDHNATFHNSDRRKGHLCPQRCYDIWQEHLQYVDMG